MLKKIYKHVGLLDHIYPYLRLLPDPVLDKLAHEIVKRGNAELDNSRFPHHLVFFVTDKCNMKCPHCFFKSRLNSNNGDMTIEQIKLLAASLRGKLHQLILTGGEPFLRNDIPAVCSVFEKYAGIQTVTIMTNGYLYDKIEADVKEILKGTSLNLNFQVSIDGPPAVHDGIRGKQGAFENAVKTIKMLRGLKNGGRIQRVVSCSALSPANAGHIEEILAELKKLKGVLHGFTIVRGSSRDTRGVPDRAMLSGLDPDDGMFLPVARIKEIAGKLDSGLWEKNRHSLYYATAKAIFNLVIEFYEERLEEIHCKAGIADFIIYPNGDVAVCEMLKPFGNIRAYNYDAEKFWEKEYVVYKDKLGKCTCAHDCNMQSMIKYDEEKIKALLKNG